MVGKYDVIMVRALDAEGKSEEKRTQDEKKIVKSERMIVREKKRGGGAQIFNKFVD